MAVSFHRTMAARPRTAKVNSSAQGEVQARTGRTSGQSFLVRAVCRFWSMRHLQPLSYRLRWQLIILARAGQRGLARIGLRQLHAGAMGSRSSIICANQSAAASFPEQRK